MYDTDHMSCCQCVGDLDRVWQRLAGTQPPVTDQTVERLAAHIFHGDEVHAIGIADFIDGDDVGVIQGGQHTRLAPEARHIIGIIGERGRKNLECHVAAQFDIVGAVHLTHSSRTERPTDLVGSQPSPGRDGHKAVKRFYAECPFRR